MNGLFNLAYFVFGLFYLPVFLVKIRQAEDRGSLLRERWGILPEDLAGHLAGKRILWLHAVSVGEVMAVQNFVLGMRSRYPEFHFFLTTVTPTGQRIAKRMQSEHVTVCYFPFEFDFCVRRFFKIVRPECLLLTETELWPNLIREATRSGVPVGVLNGRLSLKSMRGYRRLGFLLGPVFNRVGFVLAQTDEDAGRFAEIGVPAESIHVLGNMKFDNALIPENPDAFARKMREEWGLAPKDLVWIAGSTHHGEEDIVIRVFCRLRQKFSDLRLILAPRHPERRVQVEKILRREQLSYGLATQGRLTEGRQVLLVDRMGLLKNLYAAADIVFTGGSLIRHGGQSPIEPAAFKRAVIHGPWVVNFERIYRLLDQEDGSVCVRNFDELLNAAEKWLADSGERVRKGENAARIIKAWQGATERHIDWLGHFLAAEPQYAKR